MESAGDALIVARDGLLAGIQNSRHQEIGFYGIGPVDAFQAEQGRAPVLFDALIAGINALAGRKTVFYVPFYIFTIHLCALLGMWEFLNGRDYSVWEPSRSE